MTSIAVLLLTLAAVLCVALLVNMITAHRLQSLATAMAHWQDAEMEGLLAGHRHALGLVSGAQQRATNQAQAAMLDAANARLEAVRLSADVMGDRLLRRPDGRWMIMAGDRVLIGATPLEAVQLTLALALTGTMEDGVSSHAVAVVA